jgi:hypothetical protein
MIGRKPLDLNWDDQKAKNMVGKDPNEVHEGTSGFRIALG